MLFSRACEYAIQTVLYLTEHHDDKYISIKAIAENNDLSFHFLGKILQKLTQKGLLLSYKGPNGGVKLAKPPEEITLLQIVDAIDGLDFCSTECIVGMPKCDVNNPCALHHRWNEIRGDIYDMLSYKNLSQLVPR